MPTRYLVAGELELKELVKEDKLGSADKKSEVKKSLKTLF